MKKLLFSVALAATTVSPLAAREFLYKVGPFDRLQQLGDINVVYRSVPDSTGMARYVSETDFSDAIEITNSKGHLSIKEVAEHGLGEVPTIYVYSDYLSQVRNEGNSTVEAFLSASTPTFSARLIGNGRIICEGINAPEVSAAINTGNGNLVLRGKCDVAKFSLTGSGVIQADELDAQEVKCTVLGTGSIGCRADRTLDVRGVGTTKIYYRGNPTVKKVGGAQLSKIEECPDSDSTEEPAAQPQEPASVETVTTITVTEQEPTPATEAEETVTVTVTEEEEISTTSTEEGEGPTVVTEEELEESEDETESEI